MHDQLISSRSDRAERRARRRRTELEEREVDGRLTEDEARALAGWRAYEAASTTLVARAAKHPSFAAGLRRYADGGSVWLGFAGDAEPTSADLLGDYPWPERVHAFRTRFAHRQLEAIQREIAQDHRRLGVLRCVIDDEDNAVQVGVAGADLDRVRAELARFGDAVRVLPTSYLASEASKVTASYH